MMSLGIDNCAVPGCVGHLADRFERIEIEKGGAPGGVSAARDVKAPADDVRVDVVKAAVAANLGRLDDAVWAGTGRLLRPAR